MIDRATFYYLINKRVRADGLEDMLSVVNVNGFSPAPYSQPCVAGEAHKCCSCLRSDHK